MRKKELRFGDLVRTSGRPEVVALWTAPTQDRSFARAINENRVLTVTQDPKTKRKDFGRIGFRQGPHVSFFVFPRPLPDAGPARVIGINYNLIDQPEAISRASAPEPIARPRKPGRVPRKPAPKIERQFNVVVRRTAVNETSVTIAARNQKAARKHAIESVRREPFDPTTAIVRNEVKSIE